MIAFIKSQVFEELGSYMASLEKLLSLGADVLYPGHGPKVENGQESIRQYIAHRMAREKQVRLNNQQTHPHDIVLLQVTDFLQTCTEPVTAYQMVAHIYKVGLICM